MHSLASLNEVNENLGVDSIKYLANKLSHPIFPKPSDCIFGLFFSISAVVLGTNVFGRYRSNTFTDDQAY